MVNDFVGRHAATGTSLTLIYSRFTQHDESRHQEFPMSTYST